MLKEKWIKVKKLSVKRKKWVIGAAVLAVVAYAALKGAAPMTVTVVQAENGTVRKVIETTATVESVTERAVQALVNAEVLEVLKATGDHVVQGDTLAVVDVRDVNLTLRGLEAQKAALIAAMTSEDSPGQLVIKQSEAQMNSDQIALEAARRAYAQNKELHQLGAVSTETFKLAEEAMKSAEQTYASSQAAYKRLVNGLDPNQRARYKAEINVVQAQIDQMQVSKERFNIVAPVNGVITAKSVEPGQLLSAGQTLFEIDDPENIILRADVLVQDSVRMNLGMTVVAFDEDSGIRIEGKVTKIAPKAFSKLSDLGIEQKRVEVEMETASSTIALRMGMELDLEVVEALKDSVLVLPDSAIFKIDGASHVFVVTGGRAKLTPIEIGIEGKDGVEVLSGVSQGTVVVDAPGNELKDGAKVTYK